MSAVGAGAVLDAIARMRRAEREMARRRAARHLRPPKSRQCETPDRLPFPCYYLCADCGRLEPGPTPHPLRDDGSPRSPGPCPACEARAWVDLGLTSVSLAYREAEETEADMRSVRIRRRSLLLGAATGLVTLGAGLLLVTEPLQAVAGGLVMLGLAVGALTTAVVRGLSRRTRPDRGRPLRWRRPLPRPARASPVRQIQHGVVEGAATLRTPLGQEPCLGWAVRVWSDDGLLLDEQQHAALTIGDEVFEADTITLDLAPRGGLRPKADDEHFARFMQRRGLCPHEGSLRIYESRLVTGVPVALHHHRSPEGASPVLVQAPRRLDP